ncbi:MAG: FhaA domain-containing protein [Bacillota bacterium]
MEADAEAEASGALKKIYVPNYYLVRLHPDDLEQLVSIQKALTRELAEYLEQKAAERRLSLVGPVQDQSGLGYGIVTRPGDCCGENAGKARRRRETRTGFGTIPWSTRGRWMQETDREPVSRQMASWTWRQALMPARSTQLASRLAM